MAKKCSPKQNNCSKSGIGPYCQESKYGTPHKQECLEYVKEDCEETRKRCIEQCIQSKTEAFDHAREQADKKYEEAKKKAAEADAQCRETSAYKDIYGSDSEDGYHSYGLRLLYRKIATQGDIYRYLTGKNPGDGSSVESKYLAGLRANPPAAYWNNATPSDVKAEWDELNKLAKEKEEELNALCPGRKVPDKTYDVCIEGEKTSGSIATCISNCWFDSLTDCDTVHCMCDQYKCEGPELDQGAIGGVVDETSDQPVASEESKTAGNSISTLSEYDVPIELLYGREFFKGNVVWIGGVNEVRSYENNVTYDASTGKNTTVRKLIIDNYISFHLGLCSGEVDAISRVWLDGALVYDKSANAAITVSSQDRLRIRATTGSEASPVDRVEAEALGFGRVPAYRGLAGAFIENINISDLGGFPNLRFEVIKEVVDQSTIQESAEYATAGLYEIDYPHRRILVQVDDGLRVLNYDTFDVVASLDVVDFIGASALPNILTHAGSTLTINDPMHGDALSTTAVGTYDTDFKFRYLDIDNNGFELIGFMTGGNISFYRLNDMTAKAFSFNTVSGVLSGAAETCTPIYMNRTTQTSTEVTSVAYSVFLARANGGTLEIADLMCFNTDQHDNVYPQLDQATFGSYEVEFDTSNLVLLGTLACHYDKTLIFFVEYDGVNEIVKWHPDSGVVWSSVTSGLPSFGKYSPARKHTSSSHFYVDASGSVVNLNLDTGELSVISTDNPIPLGVQTFDDQLGAVTYLSEDNKFVRVYADRISEGVTTVASIIKDIAERSKLLPSDVHTSNVDDVEVIGFRSGSSLTGYDILTSLFDIYPTTSYTDSQIVFLKKATLSEVSVSSSDIRDKLVVDRQDSAHDTKSATLTYDSTSTDDTATQEFSLPDDPYEGRTALTYTYNALLDDEYARSLAELRVFAAQENDVNAHTTLPPRYLAMTPSDIMVLDKDWRVGTSTIGWDLSIEIVAYSDYPTKYSNIPQIAATPGFERFNRSTAQKACASLIAIPMRAMMPNHTYDVGVYVGAANIFDTFDSSATVSQADNEQSNLSGARAVTFNRPAVWGRLVTPPPVCASPFSTQYDATMVVKFASADVVAQLRLLTETDILHNYEACLLLVGNEFIQYLDYEVDNDGVTVTFTGLLRARHFTDKTEMEHAAGELVVNWKSAYTQEVRDYGSAFDNSFKFILTEYPDASTRVDVLFSRDAPNAFRDPGAFAITRQDYSGDGIFIRSDISSLLAYPYPDYTWMPSLDDPSVEIWLLRQPYNAVDFAYWRENFDYTDFSYVLKAGFLEATTIGGEALFGLLFSEGEQSAAGFDPTTDSIWVVAITEGLNDSVMETIKVTQFDPCDYSEARQQGINYVLG